MLVYHFHLTNILVQFFGGIEIDESETWNGFGILQFGFNDDHRYMDGLKTGKCIEIYENNIVEISGVFVEDNLQVKSYDNHTTINSLHYNNLSLLYSI